MVRHIMEKIEQIAVDLDLEEIKRELHIQRTGDQGRSKIFLRSPNPFLMQGRFTRFPILMKGLPIGSSLKVSLSKAVSCERTWTGWGGSFPMWSPSVWA